MHCNRSGSVLGLAPQEVDHDEERVIAAQNQVAAYEVVKPTNNAYVKLTRW